MGIAGLQHGDGAPMQEPLESCQERNHDNSCNPRSLRQQEFIEAYYITKRKKLDEMWATFFYESNVAFNVARHPAFVAAVKATSTAGFDYTSPSYDAMRTKHIKPKVKQVKAEIRVVRPLEPPARPLHPIDLHARPTRKYLSIFEHIRVYSRYFRRIFREYVQYARFIPDVMDRIARRPLGLPDSLQMPNMTTLAKIKKAMKQSIALYGATIYSDGWDNVIHWLLMNFMLVCLAGDIFIGSVDTTGHKKTKGIHRGGA
jgi:hypothetical protein